MRGFKQNSLKQSIAENGQLNFIENNFFSIFAQFSTNPGYVMGCGKLSNQSKIAPGGLWKRENIVSHEITLYHTMQMVLVDPCDKLIICFLWLLKGGKHNY